MKFEKCLDYHCSSVQSEVKVKIIVHLAERWCGYDIVRLSECQGRAACGVERCEFISTEEEKAFDQLIADYHKQMDTRDEIRDKLKYSNQ
jgi:hypothetical protein